MALPYCYANYNNVYFKLLTTLVNKDGNILLDIAGYLFRFLNRLELCPHHAEHALRCDYAISGSRAQAFT